MSSLIARVSFILSGIFCLSGCHQGGQDLVGTSASGAQARSLCQVTQNASSSKVPPKRASTSADDLADAGLAWMRKARLSSDPGFYLNVQACADLALALAPEHARALELRGQALMNMHEFDKARVLAESLIAREPDRASAVGLLADAQLELGLYKEAQASTQRQLSLHPDMAGHARASYLRWLAGDVPGAIRLIGTALVDRDTRNPEAAAWTFVEAGNIYWHEGKLDGADSIYEEALRWLPDYPSALAGRGRVALAHGRPDVAIGFFEKSLLRRPLVETAWLLGDAHAAQGDSSAAARSYAAAENIGRRSDPLMLAVFLAAQDRNPAEALKLLDSETRRRSGITIDDARAWALYRLGRFDEALSASDRALRLGTRDARLLFHAGAIRVALGDHVLGARQIEQALALNPAFDLSAAMKARALLASSRQSLAVARQ